MPDPAQTDSWKLFQTVAESIARDLSELPEVRKIALVGPYDRVNLTVVASGLKTLNKLQKIRTGTLRPPGFGTAHLG